MEYSPPEIKIKGQLISTSVFTEYKICIYASDSRTQTHSRHLMGREKSGIEN